MLFLPVVRAELREGRIPSHSDGRPEDVSIGDPERANFEELKKTLAKATRLAHPDHTKGFEVHPEACD